jgi:hypothetical protein
MKRVQLLVPIVLVTLIAWTGGSRALAEGARMAPVTSTSAAAAPATKRASGTVKSVSADSLTVTGADGKDWMFTIDSTTKVTAKGASTKSKEKGGKTMATDLISMGDKVTVNYHDMGGTMHAADVRVTAKAGAK